MNLLLDEFADIFADSEDKLGLMAGIQHDIFTPETMQPIVRPAYRVPYAHRDLKNHIDYLLRLGVIQPSDSPYNLPVISLVKTNADETKKCRIVADSQLLNEKTLQLQNFPLSRVDESIEKLSGATEFSSFD